MRGFHLQSARWLPSAALDVQYAGWSDAHQYTQRQIYPGERHVYCFFGDRQMFYSFTLSFGEQLRMGHELLYAILGPYNGKSSGFADYCELDASAATDTLRDEAWTEYTVAI